MNQRYIVFWISIIILSLLFIFGIMIPDVLEKITANVQAFITNAFGWYYLILVTIITVICLY